VERGDWEEAVREEREGYDLYLYYFFYFKNYPLFILFFYKNSIQLCKNTQICNITVLHDRILSLFYSNVRVKSYKRKTTGLRIHDKLALVLSVSCGIWL
jgi:hypothetical protein